MKVLGVEWNGQGNPRKVFPDLDCKKAKITSAMQVIIDIQGNALHTLSSPESVIHYWDKEADSKVDDEGFVDWDESLDPTLVEVAADSRSFNDRSRCHLKILPMQRSKQWLRWSRR